MKFLLSVIFILLTQVSLYAADLSGAAYAAGTALESALDPAKVINPFDGQNNIYERIFNELNSEYQQIGRLQAANVLANNQFSVVGGINSVGLTYHRPFGEFSIALDRNLAPDLFDAKRWIVTDTFSIHIDAHKVMQNLQNQNAINLDQKTLAAFLGVVFKRTFTWVHFADSYDEGLSTHFEKLFFPFHALTFKNMANLTNNEMIFKEDSLSLSAGGFVSAPIYPGIGVMGGVLGKFSKISRFEAVSREQNQIQMSLEKSSIKTAGFSASIEGLFFKVIKLTLLSYDFEYDHESSYKIYTNFKKSDLLEMGENSIVGQEINRIIGTKTADLTILAPYIISEEQKISQNISHSYNFLIFGGKKVSKTQEIEITTNGRVKIFFKHYYEKVKFTEDLLSRLFAGFISALMNSNVDSAKLASDTKKVEMEYDSEKNLLDIHGDVDIGELMTGREDSQKLSLNFSGEFMTRKTTGAMGKKYRDRAIFQLESYSGVDPLVSQMLGRDYLVAPLLIQGHYQVNTDGIRHFNSLSVSETFDMFVMLCDDQPKSGFLNFRNPFDNCRRSLQSDYMSYLKDLSHNKVTADLINHCEKSSLKYLFSPGKKRNYIKNCLSSFTYKDTNNWTMIPLWPLKNLSQTIVNHSNSKVHFYNLFGLSNVFFYGSVDAVTADGRAFTSAFHEGSFKGFGAVDHYMRQENLRSPASVVVDQ